MLGPIEYVIDWASLEVYWVTDKNQYFSNNKVPTNKAKMILQCSVMERENNINQQ